MCKETHLDSSNQGDALPTRNVSFRFGDLFPGFEGDSRTISVPCYQDAVSMPAVARLIPKREEGYVFQEDLLEGVLDYLSAPMNDALYIFGPSGSGKTSTVHQVAALAGWPVVEMTLNGRFEMTDLTGHNTIIRGEVNFVYGPLVRALKYGYILLLNEIDLADPAELAGLNDVLEGRPLTIVQNNGEVITPHANFRMIVTANTAGSGSEESYAGTRLLNPAFLDRFRFLESSYMPQEREERLLREQYPELGAGIAGAMVRTAAEIRRSHTCQEGTTVYMTIPMTTRALLRWAHLCQDGEGSPERIRQALDSSFGFRITREERVYLHRIFEDILGNATAEEAQGRDK
ncbi:AAA family ATPase [Succinimonas amylolytica]|uniref:AAA family ATPase n=1 Tax=Succinimonas amylolytica TaxID=83769 RepID=UPI00038009EC|nr:AAA family ATPase [Succinimonas amylolytica]